MKKIAAILAGILWTFNAHAQYDITRAISFQMGLNQTLYKSEMPESRNFSSHFLPSFAFDACTYGSNVFWGGLGVGLSPRYLPLHLYNNGVKLGARYTEYWVRFRAGFRVASDFTTHLPHISLGLAMNSSSYDAFLYGGPSQGIFYNPADTAMQIQRYRPFIEVANTIINTTFREDKRNVSIQIGIRYYPMSLFREPYILQYDPGQNKRIQYKMMEVFIAGSFQQNFHK